MLLQEELFDDVQDNAIVNLFVAAINKKWDNVIDLNSVIATLQDQGYDEYIPIIDSIIDDEHNHIGQLQQLIEMLSESAEEIEVGKEEAEEMMANDAPVDVEESLAESLRNTNNIERNKKILKKEIQEESLTEDINEDASKFYVSYYEESPAYHPEEGGYYVATCELIDSEEFDNLEDAHKRIAERAAEDTVEKITDEFYLDHSKYIGGDRFYIIETEKGSEERGDEEYQ